MIDNRSRRRPILFLSLALLLGVCAYLAIQELLHGSAREEHEPPYLRHLEPSRRNSPAENEGAVLDGGMDRSATQMTPSADRNLVGRVTYVDGSLPAECVVVLVPSSAGEGTEKILTIDSEGYFDSGPIAGRAYDVSAYGPSELMFPASSRVGIPGGPPVNIFLHRVVGCRTLVLDEVTNSPLDMSDARVALQSHSGAALPRNEFDFNPRLLGWLGEAEFEDLARKDLHLRLLGTKTEQEWRANPMARVSIQRPGVFVGEVEQVLLPAQDAARSSPTIVFANPGAEQRRVFLRFRYEDGSAPSYHMLIHVTQAQPKKSVVASGAIRIPHQHGDLIYAKPGVLQLQLGPVFNRRTREAIVTDEAVQVATIAIERGCDLVVGCGSPDRPAPAHWIAVEGLGGSGTPIKWKQGSYHRAGVLRLYDLPEGDYRLSLLAPSGRVHSATQTLSKGQLSQVWFDDSGE